MAQSVERVLGKDEVPGSNPGSSSKTKSTSQEVLFVLEMKRADAHEKRSRASPYEASLRLTERLLCASLHGNEVAASYERSECFISAQADASLTKC